VIKPGEIQKKARVVGVRDQQIEKDYILSWILQGVAKHSKLSKAIVFKGGTVLKKVYFEDYRFSEDLDFTLLDNNISNQQIFDYFNEVFEYVKEEANLKQRSTGYNTYTHTGFAFSWNGCYPQRTRRPQLRIGRWSRIKQKSLLL
jgi:predicted nucleotidyltransferase component of viral defense system